MELSPDTIRLNTLRYVCDYRRLLPHAGIFKQFIMDQHSFGGLSDCEVEYLFNKFHLRTA